MRPVRREVTALTTPAGAGFIPKPVTFRRLAGHRHEDDDENREHDEHGSEDGRRHGRGALRGCPWPIRGVTLGRPPCSAARRPALWSVRPEPRSVRVGRRSGVFDRSCCAVRGAHGPARPRIRRARCLRRGRPWPAGWSHSWLAGYAVGDGCHSVPLAACSPRWYRDRRGKQDVGSWARMLLPSQRGAEIAGGARSAR